MVTFPGYAPLYVAKEKNLFDSVDVDLLRIESIADLRAAMSAGKIDIYLATYDIFQATGNEVPPGVAFLAVDESHGADGIAVDSTKIRTVADLRGKAVAVEPGFPPFFVLQTQLHSVGMSLKDIKLNDMASQDAGTAFAARHFDAVGTYEPYLSKAIAERKGAKLLVSSRDLPGMIVDLAFADKKLLTDNPAALRAFARGWFAAVEDIRIHEVDDMRIMGKAFNVPPAEMKEFNSVVAWLDLARNRELFDMKKSNSAYEMFARVGQILDANNARGVRMIASERVSSLVIQGLQ